MNSSSYEETLAPYQYGRAQFLSDVDWMGLDPEQAFSRSSLRHQRDRLMQLHHPDRGGSEQMAARINITYSRMIFWLDRHLDRRGFLRKRRDEALARQAVKYGEKQASPAKHRIESIRFYATILGAAAAAVGLGLNSMSRRRR